MTTPQTTGSDAGGGGLFPVPKSLRLARPLRWEYTFLFVVGLVFWGGYWLHEGSALRVGYRMDFLGIYVGPRMLVSGVGSQLYDLPTQAAFSAAAVQPLKRGPMPFIYPAYVAVILKPLGLLKFTSALKIWFLVNLTAVFWSALRLARFFGCRRLDQLAVLVIFLAWWPLQLTLIQGQIGLMPTVGFTEALIALRARREWRAGCWFSLGLMKPQMILFPILWFLMRRCWRVLAAFTVVSLAVVGVSIVAVGFWIPNYIHFLAEYNRRGAELALYPIAMQNWRGLASWLFHADHGWGVRVVTLVLTFLSALGAWLVAQHRNSRLGQFSLTEEAQYAIAIILGLLSSPHLYMHDWVAALPAGFVLWSFARETYERDSIDRRASVLLWLIGFSPLVFFTKNFIRTAPTVPVFGAVFAGIAIWMLTSPGLNSRTAERTTEAASA
jgi:hypothetical protein